MGRRDRLDEQAGCKGVFVCTGKGVPGCAPTPISQGCGEEAQALLPPPTLGACGGWRSWTGLEVRLTMLGSSCLLASVSSSLTWGSGLTVSVPDGPGTGGQVHWPAKPRCPPLIHPTPNASPHTAMVELDGDDVRISSRGKLAERDIVQVKPKSCLPQGKRQSPSHKADLIPPFREFSGKGPWKEPPSGLATIVGNRNQSLGHTSPPAGPLPTMSETSPKLLP